MKHLHELMYLFSCPRDESVLTTEVLLYIGEIEQVAVATGPACDAGGMTENSHQALQLIHVGLALLHTLGHTAHQITRATGTHNIMKVSSPKKKPCCHVLKLF